jgi:hypothetical protein
MTNSLGFLLFYMSVATKMITVMNIEADSLATQALKDGLSQPIVPFDPACGAMLSIIKH